MKQQFLLLSLILILMGTSCQKTSQVQNEQSSQGAGISQSHIDSAIDELINLHGKANKERIEKGVTQIAQL
jgi:hypothetical protein